MRRDGVVPFRQSLVTLEKNPLLLLRRSFDFHAIGVLVQNGSAAEPGFRACSSDIFQHRFVIEERLAFPVLTDQAEHTVLDQIPLGGSWRVVVHRDP